MGTKERKKRERESRRIRILDAAEKVFFDNGLDNSSMEEVADAAELSKGTLYLYFRNKDDLFHGVIHRALCTLRDMFSNAVAGGATGGEKLTRIGEAYLRYYHEYPEYFDSILHQEKRIREPSGEEESYFRKCNETGKEIFRIMETVIREGITDGSLRPDIDPLKHSLVLWGQVTGILEIIRSKGEMLEKMTGKSAEDLIDYTFDLIRRCSVNNNSESPETGGREK